MKKNTTKKIAAVDVETEYIIEGRRKDTLRLLCVSIVDTKGKILFQCLWDDNPDDLNESLERLQEEGYTLCFHNGKFDVGVLRYNGVNIGYNKPGKVMWHDTMCMSYVLNPESMENHSLAILAELVDEEKFPMPPLVKSTDLLMYNAQDCKVTAKLCDYFLQMFVESEPSLWHYYEDIELPYIEVLIDLERSGLYLDKELFFKEKQKYIAASQKNQIEIDVVAGFTRGREIVYSSRIFSHYTKSSTGSLKPIEVGFHNGLYDRCEIHGLNVNSGDQIMDALARLYGYEPSKFTPKGKPRCDAQTLKTLTEFPLVRLILEQSKINDMLSKFFNSIESKMTLSGEIHGDLIQFNTRTRRLSSRSPNLQNIPARGDEGASIRQCFIAPPGYNLVVGDLDRIEVVILAYYLEELLGASHLANLIREGVDIHTHNSEKWGIDRPLVKNGLFCFLYGGGRNKLAETLGVSKKVASSILETMEDNLPELFEFRELMVTLLEEENGILHDLFGGRIMIPEVNSHRPEIKQSATRKVVNYLIQGTAGSVFKYLQLKSFWELRGKFGEDAVMFGVVVHDELLVYVRDSPKFVDVPDFLTDCFCDNDILVTDKGSIPISAKFHIGANWYDAKK